MNLRTCLVPVLALVLVAGAGCATAPEPEPESSYVVIFELNPDASGRLQRLAVASVLDRETQRVVVYLPSARFVNQARDTLVEFDWPATRDRNGRIEPVYVRCFLSTASPHTPDCPPQ